MRVAIGLLALLALIGAVAWATTPQQLKKADPIVRRIAEAELYRTRTCIVTRITVFEPSPIRPAVTEFYVIEGGSEHGQVQYPKCKVELIR